MRELSKMNQERGSITRDMLLMGALSVASAVAITGIVIGNSQEVESRRKMATEISAGELAKLGCNDTATEYKVSGYAQKVGTESTYMPYMFYDFLSKMTKVQFVQHSTTTYHLHEKADGNSPYISIVEQSDGVPIANGMIPFVPAPQSDYSDKVSVVGHLGEEQVKGGVTECTLVPSSIDKVPRE